jgi:hypothetical protein
MPDVICARRRNGPGPNRYFQRYDITSRGFALSDDEIDTVTNNRACCLEFSRWSRVLSSINALWAAPRSSEMKLSFTGLLPNQPEILFEPRDL